MIFPGTMHYGRHIYLFSKCYSSAFTGSKQRQFSDKNYRLQKLVRYITHYMWDKEWQYYFKIVFIITA